MKKGAPEQVTPVDLRKAFGAHLFEEGAKPLPGAYAPIVSAIFDNLVMFALADLRGHKASAAASLEEARMRFDELQSRAAPKRAVLADKSQS